MKVPVAESERKRRRKAAAISGVVAIEFAFVLPLLLILLMGILETGLTYFAQFVLKNATVATARVIRTGSASSTGTTLVNYICTATDSSLGKLAANIILPSCTSTLRLYTKNYTTTGLAGFPSIAASDLASTGSAGVSTTLGAMDSTALPCNVILLRVTYPWTVVTPGLSWFLVNYGSSQHLLTATEIFQNEPSSGGSSQCS